MLLSYILNSTQNLLLELILVEIDPFLLKFLEQRGVYTATNRVKIESGAMLALGAPDGTTGYPGYINGIGRGVGQVGNRSIIAFQHTEARSRYSYGIRMAFYDLIKEFKVKTTGMTVSMPYVAIFYPSNKAAPIGRLNSLIINP